MLAIAPEVLAVYLNVVAVGTASTKNGPAANCAPEPTLVIWVVIVLPGINP